MALDAQGNEVGKIFVGGLHQSTNTNGLHEYFAKFGEIEESVVMMDNRTGRSRGFGYVKFKEAATVDHVLSEKVHVIDNKEVDPKRCNINMRGKNRRSLKVFVGGIALEHDDETIRSFFQSFGNVTDVNLLTNPTKSRHRGFAFVGFDDEEVVKTLIKLHFVNLNGKQVEIKPMEPPNLQKALGYIPPGVLNTHGNGRPVRGSNRMNAVNSNCMSYGSWNPWNHTGGGGNGLDMSGCGAGGDWNQIMNNQTPTPWNSQSRQWSNPSVLSNSDPSSSSPMTDCWDNTMTAAMFQQNGLPTHPHQWSSLQPPSRHSALHGSEGDPTLLDYNSWSAHQIGGSIHPTRSTSTFSQPASVIGDGGGGGGQWGGANDFVSQWRTGGAGPAGAGLWSGSGAGDRPGHNDLHSCSGLGVSLGSRTCASPGGGTFKIEESLYRVSSNNNEGVGGTREFPVSETDWQNALTVAAMAAQQRSVLAAAAASAASPQSLKR